MDGGAEVVVDSFIVLCDKKIEFISTLLNNFVNRVGHGEELWQDICWSTFFLYLSIAAHFTHKFLDNLPFVGGKRRKC